MFGERQLTYQKSIYRFKAEQVNVDDEFEADREW
jgi:hypothetical protein